MMQFISFIGSIGAGLGLGSLISAWLIQHWERKKLIYQTKLNIYSAFIQGYQEYVAKTDDERLRQLCVSYQKQVELVAPLKVLKLSREFYKASHGEVHKIRDELVEAMREDLGSL